MIGDWLVLSPPIIPLFWQGSRAKFWGNTFEDPDTPPNTVVFPVDETVTVCFKTRPRVDRHLGFRAEITEVKKSKLDISL